MNHTERRASEWQGCPKEVPGRVGRGRSHCSAPPAPHRPGHPKFRRKAFIPLARRPPAGLDYSGWMAAAFYGLITILRIRKLFVFLNNVASDIKMINYKVPRRRGGALLAVVYCARSAAPANLIFILTPLRGFH